MSSFPIVIIIFVCTNFHCFEHKHKQKNPDCFRLSVNNDPKMLSVSLQHETVCHNQISTFEGLIVKLGCICSTLFYSQTNKAASQPVFKDLSSMLLSPCSKVFHDLCPKVIILSGTCSTSYYLRSNAVISKTIRGPFIWSCQTSQILAELFHFTALP